MKTLDKIQNCLQENTSLNGIGISNGILGKSLFYYYNYLYTQEEKWLELAINIIEDALEMLTNEYSSISPQNDIIETAIYISFLIKNQVLSNEVEFILNDLEDLIEEIFNARIINGDLDGIKGVFAPLQYYLYREKNCTEKLEQVFKIVEQNAIVNETEAYWMFNLRSKENSYVELGFNHGVSGIISFLLDCYIHNVKREESEILVNKGLCFLEKQQNKSNTCWFPQTTNKNDFLPYHNLSYGDLGIGFTFYKAGEILQNNYWRSIGIEILENAAQYTDEKESHIRDANMIYGASGLYSFFDMMFRLTANKHFKIAKDYWYNNIFQKGNNDTVWAGFNTYYNGVYEFAQLGISQGILGIGLTLLSKELDIKNEYLNFLNFRKW
ncbi:lanthionine synthetase LanC family protein [Tenacibaculum sp. MEBiC06402]|uniref:lanthionine synthetase LanC family protein n=1 Tax=unclassified Tenacibaculum TaxID=2635139 RepID=UPI003B9C3A92